ncbi:hypothetical protein HU147_18570 [Planomicrobium chinense]|uniref:hypothetical protein n=1 Tax=Planococcus chinensis TaxID=272917 RepID=UPI001CC4BDBC|nr:hypothetical protein [Planococcus chinensis]MBZ5203211.1 hypothetical protein [Planococcus chinensis]
MDKDTIFDWWFNKGNKNITIKNFKHIRIRNYIEYGHDPEINTKRRWGIHTNGARKGNPKDSCLDWQLDLGHIHINYTDFNYNCKHR